MNIKNILKKYKNKPLSNFDIQKLLDNKVNIILYSDLHKYNSLDNILEPYGACILLYQSRNDFGHWCAVIKIDDETIEFFDPYGVFPDDQLKMIPKYFRNISNQNYPHLSWLLYNSPYPKLTYNEYQFQKKDDTIQTCGRHCVLRVILKYLPLKKYVQLFHNINPDNLVTLISIAIN